MSKWKCENPNCKKPCYAEPPERCYPTGCLLSRNNTPHWNQMAEPVTNCNQLPKLTAEVFDRSDCPAWAQWAAVDNRGVGWYFSGRPDLFQDGFYPLSWQVSNKEINILGQWDASDWKNSLIERPEKKEPLPDWCKVGEWVYSTVYKEYVQISDIDEFEVSLKNGAYCSVGIRPFFEDYLPASLRPYNAEEMRGLIGKVLTSNSRSTPFSFLVVYAEADGSFIESYRFKYTAEELKDHFTIDGKPCGVLEHLENGEWVE